MAEQLISASGPQYGLVITSQGEALISGNVHAVNQETNPIDSSKNNPSWKFEYDSNNNVGSVTQFIDTGSFVNVLTWEGYSGLSIGVGSNITNVGSYS